MAHFAKTLNFIYGQSLFRRNVVCPSYNILKFLRTSESRDVYQRNKKAAPFLRELKERVDILKDKDLYPAPIRSQFLEWNYEAELYAFGKRLNEEFNEYLLKEAFTDASYVAQEEQRLKDVGMDSTTMSLKDNSELASAGRALIEDYCTKFYRAVCPLLPEEAIRSFVDYLISDEVLGKIGKDLGFTDLILGKEYPPSEVTFARSFAAVVGCLNGSSGVERCQMFIRDLVAVQLLGKDLWDIWQVDPFHILEGILVRSGRGNPEPRLLGDIGGGTIESVFYVGIYDGNKEMVGKGYGETVQIGIKVAAYDALSKMFNQTNARDPFPFQFQDINDYMKMEPNTSLSQWVWRESSRNS